MKFFFFKKLNKIDFISILFLIFSFIIFGYILYRSEFIHSGYLGNYYFKYKILSISLIFSSLLLFFLNKSLKKNILLIISSLLLSFYIIECSLSFYQNNVKKIQQINNQNIIQSKINEYNSLNKKKYDTRPKSEIYEALLKNNSKVGIVFLPENIKISNDKFIYPLSPASSYTLTIDCNENGYYSKFLSDRNGYNNPDNEWDKNEHLFFIGDSFVQGSCVNQGDTISSQVAKLINSDVGILNLGVANTGPLIQFAILKEYITKLKPKKIFWFFYEGNDMDNLKNELGFSILTNYLNDINFIQNIGQYQKEIDIFYFNRIKDNIKNKKILTFNKVISSEKNFFFKILTLNKLRKLLANFFYEPPINEFINIIKSADLLARENGAELNVIFIPDIERYSYPNNKNLNHNNYKKIINKIKNLNIKTMDLKIDFDNQKDFHLLFPTGYSGHFNSSGYNVIANLIFNKFLTINY